ncbi:MAG: hypothetical protein DSZ08_01430 [Sulfurovum sp.]|nr:MAG: hypothetical protein DSZ08_01430 [Sulfurovum sp.]
MQHDAKDTTAMIQADVYYADITDTFGRFKNKKTLFSTLYLFPVSLRSPDGRFAMSLRCQALSRGVNINWLGMEEKQNMREAYSFAQTVFDTVAQDYNIEDASRLLEMLLEEIGGKKQFVKKEYSRLRQKNGIISYKQFAQIVSNYQMEVDDTKVSRIPWRKYFTFSKDAKVIDAEYSSAELISLLFDVDVQSVKEWQSDPERSSLQAFVRENSGDYAARKKIIAGNTFLAESECTVAYKSSAEQYKFRFEYIQGEAKHFEFYKKN